jgi:hypothetical protein
MACKPQHLQIKTSLKLPCVIRCQPVDGWDRPYLELEGRGLPPRLTDDSAPRQIGVPRLKNALKTPVIHGSSTQGNFYGRDAYRILLDVQVPSSPHPGTRAIEGILGTKQWSHACLHKFAKTVDFLRYLIPELRRLDGPGDSSLQNAILNNDGHHS